MTALSVRELGDQRFYNLGVATTHAVHVGTNRMLVHNCGGSRKTLEEAGEELAKLNRGKHRVEVETPKGR